MYDPTCIQPFVEMGLEIVHRCLFRALYRRFRFARAQPVNALIADDMVEPGPDFGTVGLPVGSLLGKPQQCLLGDILCLGPVAKPVPGKPHNRRQMSVDEAAPAPGSLVAARGVAYQLVVGNLRQILTH
jgi:hypothetical protein